MNDQELLRYSRHILLDEIGIEGQQRIRDASVLVIGAGGLGCPAALYLAAAGIGRLVIADGDEVDLTNLQRQILHRPETVGIAKTESARRALNGLNADCRIETLPRLDEDAMHEAVRGVDLALDCSDNFATRHSLNRACVQHGVPLVSGAAIRFDGQVCVFDTRKAESPCYHCLFPESAGAEEVRCATMGVFAPLTGVVGTLQAGEALKIVGGFGEVRSGRMLLLSLKSGDLQQFQVSRDPACAVCGHRSAHHSAQQAVQMSRDAFQR